MIDMDDTEQRDRLKPLKKDKLIDLLVQAYSRHKGNDVQKVKDDERILVLESVVETQIKDHKILNGQHEVLKTNHNALKHTVSDYAVIKKDLDNLCEEYREIQQKLSKADRRADIYERALDRILE